MPNADLLKRTLAHIEAHPEQWFQGNWRGPRNLLGSEHWRQAEAGEGCGTAFCFAGWAAELSGVTWVYPPDHRLSYTVLTPGEEEIAVDLYARLLLDLDFYEAADLFASDNTLDDLRRIVAELSATPASLTTPREDSTP